MKGQFLFDLPLPAGWRLLSVDDLKASEKHSCVAGPFGSSISSKFFVEQGVPVIRGGNLRDDLTPFVAEGFVFVSPEQAQRYKGQHVRGGDLVFTCWGTLGQVGLIPKDGPFPEYIISNKQLKLRPNGGIADSRFLFYYFGSPQMVQHIRSIAIGAAVPGINLGLLKGLQVALPPLDVQKAIVEVLSAYDDLIENNTRRSKILEEMAQMIYREWFVNFRFPGHEKVRMVESELGRIPEGWKSGRLRDVANVLPGFAFKSQDWQDVGIPVIKIANITDRYDVDVDSVDRVAASLLTPRLKRYELRSGDLLVAMTGATAGKTGRLRSGCPMLLNQRVAKIEPKEGYETFVACTVLRPEQRVSFFRLADGAAQPNMSSAQIEGTPVLIPSLDVAARFEAVVAGMLRLVDNGVVRNRNLRTTRDLLLPKLISGEISVEAADEAAAELMEQTA